MSVITRIWLAIVFLSAAPPTHAQTVPVAQESHVFSPDTDLTGPLQIVMDWLKAQPVIGTLLALMLIDFLTGVFVAIIKQRISSTISWKGMSKKAITLLIVGMGIILDSAYPGLAFAKIIALFYIATEGISIMENAALANVPFPAFITNTFMKMRESSSAGPSTPGPNPPDSANPPKSPS